jgi:hypothetical protein
MGWIMTGIFIGTTIFYATNYHKQVQITIKERLRPYE